MFRCLSGTLRYIISRVVRLTSSYHFSVLSNRQFIHSIGRNFCVEGNDTIPQDGATINCTLKEIPVPPPQFNMSMTRVFSNDTIQRPPIQQSETEILSISASQLSLLFEEETLILRITCNVSNLFGSDSMTTDIRVCGMCT